MSGIIDIASVAPISNPLGTRVGVSWIAGNFTDHTGKIFAKVVPGYGGENGLVDSAGYFHVNARMILQLINESNTYAYLQYTGVGKYGDVNNFYLTAETNSTQYGYLNDMFIWGAGTIPGAHLLVNTFSPTNPA